VLKIITDLQFIHFLFFSQVINEFLNKKEEFLNNVFTNPNYLEDLTGLTKLKDEFENIQVSSYFEEYPTNISY